MSVGEDPIGGDDELLLLSEGGAEHLPPPVGRPLLFGLAALSTSAVLAGLLGLCYSTARDRMLRDAAHLGATGPLDKMRWGLVTTLDATATGKYRPGGGTTVPTGSSSGFQGCPLGKEVFEDLCYPTCESLTAGNFSYRTGACTCCKEDPQKGGHCGASNIRTDCTMLKGNSTPEPGTLLRSSECNICTATEELFDKLCYKTCALLTNGEAGQRLSNCECCANARTRQGCQPADCATYNVDSFGGLQGRVPNTIPQTVCNPCLAGYEFFHGECFKTCASLTGGGHPIRNDAASCCSTEPCDDPGHSWINPLYGVGVMALGREFPTHQY